LKTIETELEAIDIDAQNNKSAATVAASAAA